MAIVDSEEKQQVIKEIKYLESQLGRIIRPPPGSVWLDLNVSIAQLKTLFYLRHEGSTSLGKLAEALGVTPPNVTGIVDRLVEQGLLSREENPENRRQLILKLTDKSNLLLERLWESNRERFNSILNEMDIEDLAALNRGLRAVIALAADRDPLRSESII